MSLIASCSQVVDRVPEKPYTIPPLSSMVSPQRSHVTLSPERSRDACRSPQVFSFEISPMRINPSYCKQVTVMNLSNRANDQYVNIQVPPAPPQNFA